MWSPSFQCVCTCAALVELVVLQGPPELYVKHLNHLIHCSQLFMQFINILNAWTRVQHVYLQSTQHILYLYIILS
jgi:hypothetical protein